MESVPPIEIGSLTALSPNESKFIGSSSGIFFVNTVRRAFAGSNVRSPDGEDVLPEDGADAETYIGGIDADENENSGFQTPRIQPESLQARLYGVDTRSIGQPPKREDASKLIQVYFRVWHPLFPFLHGPTFLEDIEAYYMEQQVDSTITKAELRNRQYRAITFQCVFNIAALDRPDLRLPANCTIKSAAGLTTQLCSLAIRNNIPVLQALLAGQIYLIATMSLHAASTLSAVLLRLILHGGLHRCPCRYSQLSPHDADIRKRIFWSAYAVDRYLSQALGLPLGIQDSDIDVCVPGSIELHRPVPSQECAAECARSEVLLHLPEGHPNLDQAHSEASPASHDRRTRQRSEVSSYPDGHPSTNQIQPEASVASNVQFPRPRSVSSTSQSRERAASKLQDRRPGELALANYVAYGRLTGRALEMLHKSLNVRTVQYSNVLELTSDIHSFWNALPQQLQDLPKANGDKSQNVLGIFFTIIYQQLILLVNRPFLSSNQSSLEFRLSLQACISASRVVISTLKNQATGQPCISWPGTLSVTWMSGLVLAFSCTLGLYPIEKGFPEMRSCLQLLKGMRGSSKTAKYCHSALKSLVDDLSSSQQGENLSDYAQPNKRTNPFSPPQDFSRSQSQPSASDSISKRQRLEDGGEGSHPPRNNLGSRTVGNAEQDRDYPAPSNLTYAAVGVYSHQDAIDNSGNSNFAPFWTQQPGSNPNGNQPAAYGQDLFNQLSCENLFQSDEDFSSDFWNMNNFPLS